jgi:hypothetical protein
MVRGVVLLAGALLASGCCCGGGGAGKFGSESSARPAGIGSGVVNAKRTATNNTGRGIVRSAPNFQAAEVTRLDPGTPVTIKATAPGGWYAISWPVGTNSQSGFLHGDVMQQITMF